jgi:hypothetical protein
VHVLRGEDLTPIGRIELGDDADNVRLDAARNRVLVGYGKGVLAVIDPASLTKTTDIRLKAHPEEFQIDETGTQVFVNVPDALEIGVVDLATGSTRSLPGTRCGIEFSDGDRWRGASGPRGLSQPAGPDGALQPGRPYRRQGRDPR